MSSLLLLFFLISSSESVSPHSCSSASSSRHSNSSCPPFVSPPTDFPFSTSPGCNHPSFQIRCSSPHSLLLINSSPFLLLQHHPSPNSFTLTPFIPPPSSSCTLPTQPINLSSSPFFFSPSPCPLLATFSHLCAAPPPRQQISPSCNLSSWQLDLLRDPLLLFTTCSSFPRPPPPPPCNGSDDDPNRRLLNVSRRISTFLAAGFRVGWDLGNDRYNASCSACRRSVDGACGFNDTAPSKPFLCFPSLDRLEEHHRHPLLKRRSLFLVVAILAVACIFLVAISLYAASAVRNRWRRRGRRGESMLRNLFLNRHQIYPPIFSYDQLRSSTDGLNLVVVDSQEAGIRLVHTLLACAEAVQQENYKAADALVKQISVLAASQGGAMRKVAGYFAESLARRIYRLHPQQDCSLESAFSDILQMHFYESCPYLKFAHFTANQAILEAFEGCRRVHVIDFSMKQGMQWPALMQALALRPGGPPAFRLTGIGPPQPDNTDALQQVGWKLAQLADTIHVDFEYRGFVANSLADLEPFLLESAPKGKADLSSSDKELEAVAVNSVFELHRLLARPGAVEKVLNTVKSIKPKIVTVVEQEANHNSGSFSDRFTEALHYYSAMFDSLEGGGGGGSDLVSGGGQQDQIMTEVYLGRQICNVVACEGFERTERHENLVQWRNRFGRAGFEPVHLGSNAFKQASMLLALFAGGDGYRVEEKDGCLTLGWHTRPLIATSAWRVAES